MNEPVIRCRVAFRARRRAAPAAAVDAEPYRPAAPTALARRLALAHLVERLIEEGTVRDLADAARRLGITRARMSQIADLALLAIDVQERVLAGELLCGERGIRRTSA